MICPKCKLENDVNNKFCESCGHKLAKEEKSKLREKQVVNSLDSKNILKLNTNISIDSSIASWLTKENIFWLFIFIVAAFLRFYALGDKPLHHDESLHAFYSWKLFRGDGYSYNPMMHGPLLFHFNALMYYLFGASDYTCRIMPAFLAMVTLVMVYFSRPLLGRAGALFTGIIVTISPSFTYFGRFIRNDIYIAAFTMFMIYGLFRYFDTRKDKFLYLSAAGLGLSFCTKELTYITGVIIVTYLGFRWLWEHTTKPEKPENKLIEIINNLFVKDRKPLWIGLGICFGIILILYTTVFTNPKGFIDAFTKSISYWLDQHEVQRGSQPVYFYAGLLPLYELLSVLGTIAALIYYSFIKSKQNIIGRTLGYIILGAAWFLFVLHGEENFGLIFSLLLVCMGTGLLAYFSFDGKNNFETFLILWALAAFSDYSFAGERMPWLILHPLLPMVLLTGKFLGEIWENIEKARVYLLIIFILLGSMLMRNTCMLNFYGAGANPAELLVYVQSSPDVKQVVKQITNVSKRLKGNKEMKITCEDYCSWPFAWYLRDFKFVGYPKFAATQAEGSIEKNPIIITGVEAAMPGHDNRVAELLSEEYIAQRYKLRVWWAPDKSNFFNATFKDKVKKAWRLFLYREPWNNLGSYDMIIYIRKDIEHLYWSNADEGMYLTL